MKELHYSQALEFLSPYVLLLIVVCRIGIHQTADSGGQKIHDGVVSPHADGEIRTLQKLNEVWRVLLHFYIPRLTGETLQNFVHLLRDEGARKDAKPMREFFEQNSGPDDVFQQQLALTVPPTPDARHDGRAGTGGIFPSHRDGIFLLDQAGIPDVALQVSDSMESRVEFLKRRVAVNQNQVEISVHDPADPFLVLGLVRFFHQNVAEAASH